MLVKHREGGKGVYRYRRKRFKETGSISGVDFSVASKARISEPNFNWPAEIFIIEQFYPHPGRGANISCRLFSSHTAQTLTVPFR